MFHVSVPNFYPEYYAKFKVASRSVRYTFQALEYIILRMCLFVSCWELDDKIDNTLRLKPTTAIFAWHKDSKQRETPSSVLACYILFG